MAETDDKSDSVQVKTYMELKARKLRIVVSQRKGERHKTMSEMLEKILSSENMNNAYKRVYANHGASGVDGVNVEQAKDYIKEHWESISEQIRKRSYAPQPVRRVYIPKPNGDKRPLGIPTVMDRIIQQAIVQVLSPICEEYFSEYSYGFRPGRSCEKAIMRVLDLLNDGYDWIVDIDLEKFFDKVPQIKLMSYVHQIIDDPDTESLIGKYLKAGVMENGVKVATEMGTPQGGNISPLLSNIMLNKLDKELEARELNFVRYADDCVILVRSEASAKRVMNSISRFIENKLGLKVNMTKTKVTRPSKLKYLGFGFYYDFKTSKWKARPHKDSVEKFKRKLKALTKRNWSIDMTERLKLVNYVIRGWINYFRIGDMSNKLREVDMRLRTRIRIIIWKQWKVPSKRRWGLLKLGVPVWLANKLSQWGDHYQLVALKGIHSIISKEILAKRGLVSCLDYYNQRHVVYV